MLRFLSFCAFLSCTYHVCGQQVAGVLNIPRDFPPADYTFYKGNIVLMVDNQSSEAVTLRIEGTPFYGHNLQNDFFYTRPRAGTAAGYTSEKQENYALLAKSSGPNYSSFQGLGFQYRSQIEGSKGLPLYLGKLPISLKAQTKPRAYCTLEKPVRKDQFVIASALLMRYSDDDQCLLKFFTPGDKFDEFVR